MSGFLLDNNVISELVKPRPEPGVTTWIEATDETLHLSVLTLGEIRRGVVALPQARRRRTLEAWLETDLRSRFHGRILSIDDRVADRWGAPGGPGAKERNSASRHRRSIGRHSFAAQSHIRDSRHREYSAKRSSET